MKKLKIIIFAVSLISNLQYLSAQDADFYINPGEKTVTTGSIVTLRVVLGKMGDTSNTRISDNIWVKNWCVNGEPGNPNLLVGGSYATYEVPDQVPDKNPVAISCDLVNKDPAIGKITLVSNIYVEDVSNQLVLDGATYIIEAGKDTSINNYSTSNVRAIYGGNKTICNIVGGAVNFAITFPGDKPGTYKWNQETVAGGSVHNQAYGSLDPNTKESAPGETVVTEYGEIGKLIKGYYHGVLWTQVGMKVYSVEVKGKFSVVHTKY